MTSFWLSHRVETTTHEGKSESPALVQDRKKPIARGRWLKGKACAPSWDVPFATLATSSIPFSPHAVRGSRGPWPAATWKSQNLQSANHGVKLHVQYHRWGPARAVERWASPRLLVHGIGDHRNELRRALLLASAAPRIPRSPAAKSRGRGLKKRHRQFQHRSAAPGQEAGSSRDKERACIRQRLLWVSCKPMMCLRSRARQTGIWETFFDGSGRRISPRDHPSV